MTKRLAKEKRKFFIGQTVSSELANTSDAKGCPAAAGRIDTQWTTGREIGSNLSLT